MLLELVCGSCGSFMVVSAGDNLGTTRYTCYRRGCARVVLVRVIAKDTSPSEDLPALLPERRASHRRGTREAG
jgi:hypothetical protein